jgi:SAM-dependent methyltransferase
MRARCRAVTQDMKETRARLYKCYVTTHVQPDARLILEELRRRAPYIRRLIHDWFPPDKGASVLDLGCGYGAVLYYLKQLGYSNLRGVDGSPEQVTIAQRLGLHFVELHEAMDVLKCSRDNSYDILIAFDLLEHLTKDEAIDLVGEAFRILTHGGRLLVHVPNGEAIFSGAVVYGDLTHQTALTRRSIGQLMRVAGFERIHVREDSPTIHGVASAARWIAWKVFRSLYRLIYLSETGDTRQPVLSQNLLAVGEKE